MMGKCLWREKTDLRSSGVLGSCFVAVPANSRYVMMYSSVRNTGGQSMGCQWNVQGGEEGD